jgi:hypothetical protein
VTSQSRQISFGLQTEACSGALQTVVVIKGVCVAHSRSRPRLLACWTSCLHCCAWQEHSGLQTAKQAALPSCNTLSQLLLGRLRKTTEVFSEYSRAQAEAHLLDGSSGRFTPTVCAPQGARGSGRLSGRDGTDWKEVVVASITYSGTVAGHWVEIGVGVS